MNRPVQLVSSDGQVFHMEEEVALECKTLTELLEGVGPGQIIPLPNVPGVVLAKVLEYTKFHVQARRGDAAQTDEEVERWDREFMLVEQGTLFDLILAANYLNHGSLLEMLCKATAGMIRGKTPTEIRAYFGLTMDFSTDDEDDIRRENQWAFD